MTTAQRLLLILLLAGCEQPPATLPQTSPAATVQNQPTAEPAPPTPPMLPDAPTEPLEQADEITGKIDILTSDESTIRIRLNGIDAPESGQPFGMNAKQNLSEFIGLQVVRVVTHGEDRLNVATPISLPLACIGDEEFLKSQ